MCEGQRVFVLVGGWPGSGKSTLARSLGPALGLPVLAKDDLKEVLADALGDPPDVPASRALGRAAVLVMLRAAAELPGAVLDSTWFPYARPSVTALPGPVVEIHCSVAREVARDRYRARADSRQAVHLDLRRTDDELWRREWVPLGIGPVLVVDTTHRVDVPALADRLRRVGGIG